MSATKLLPYLGFNDNCREAMEFYQSVLGGELKITTVGESQPDVPEDQKNRVMHADLQNDTLSFMASDNMMGTPIVFGDNISMSLIGTDEAQLTKFFTDLSVGGTPGVPLAKAPWGDTFGMFTDKFGIHWMVNIGPAQA
jgi:PhnB protein